MGLMGNGSWFRLEVLGLTTGANVPSNIGCFERAIAENDKLANIRGDRRLRGVWGTAFDVSLVGVDVEVEVTETFVDVFDEGATSSCTSISVSWASRASSPTSRISFF